MAVVSPLSMKIQTWGDDLRLPILTNPATILSQIESLRHPSIPLQSKHLPALKRNIWYTLHRPVDRSRTGLLCVLPNEQCCVYISGEPITYKRPEPRVALLRLRIDPQFFAPGTGLTVFAATLSAANRKLWVEDVIMWKGRAVCDEEPFQKRWELVAQWLEHYCVLDSRLIGDVHIEMAKWQALEDVKPEGVWDFIQDQAGTRRLLWIAGPGPSPPSTTTATESVTLSVPTTTGIRIATATKESGPDQWGLKSADGVSLGRALIRTLSVSMALRSASGQPHVVVTWNDEFKKWEITALTSDGVSHSSVFVTTAS
jgi:hypothetical protein